jgi:hypothetical protein
LEAANFVVKALKQVPGQSLADVQPLLTAELQALTSIRALMELRDAAALAYVPTAEQITSYALKITPYCGGMFVSTASTLRQLLTVLFYTHACGWVHRDVRPDNIRMCGDTIVLLDWGYAVRAGQVCRGYCGTLQFAAIDILQQADLDYGEMTPMPRHDLHSVVMMAVALRESPLARALSSEAAGARDHQKILQAWQTERQRPDSRLPHLLQRADAAASAAQQSGYAEVRVYQDLAVELASWS